MTNSTEWGGVTATTLYSVHLGTWINWSRGPVMGATLTTTRQDGNLLIAFTAFFVSFISSRFWHIACFVFHRCYSTPEPQDALHHQRQAVFRNSGSSASGLMMLAQLAWSWRSSAKRCLLRMLPAILTATLFISAFTVAGGFSSRISSGVGNDVLLDGSNCCLIDDNLDNMTVEETTVLTSNIAQTVEDAANYAQQCYSNDRSGMLDCTSFVKDHLPSTGETQAPCPFTGDICRDPSSNLRLDTGLLDSDEFFGLNAPNDQHILFREVLQCGPLITEPFVRNISTLSKNYTAYDYGHDWLGNNFTYLVETLDEQYPQGDGVAMSDHGGSFVVTSYRSYSQNDTTNAGLSTFIPIPQLFRADGDTLLVFLVGNGVYFWEQTNDPWYRGTVPGAEAKFSNNETGYGYRPEEAASPMGCVEQFQFCNADKECGPLAGYQDAIIEAASLFNATAFIDNGTVPDNPIGSRFYWYLFTLSTMSIDLDFMILTLGSHALLSQRSTTEGAMGTLPDNQWQLDVAYWWAIRLASMQAAFVDTASGTTVAALQDYRIPPNNSDMRGMCNNQKILSTDYTSFSLFGLYFTYITGLLITVASFILEPVYAFLHRRGKKHEQYKYLEWTATETLQLQRLAYQGIESGTWSGYTDSVPMTKPREILGDLPASYQVPGNKPAGCQSQNAPMPGHAEGTGDAGSSIDGSSAATTITPGDADQGPQSGSVHGNGVLPPPPSPPTAPPEPAAGGAQGADGAGAVDSSQQPAGPLNPPSTDGTAERTSTAASQAVIQSPADGQGPAISQPSVPAVSPVSGHTPSGNA